MIELRGKARWPMLPGGEWRSPGEARLWLKQTRARLGWTHKDVDKAFASVAYSSDLYSGPGGGALFDRATEKRALRFEEGGEAIPDWLYWIPLAVERAGVPDEERWAWEFGHVPENSQVNRDRAEEESTLAPSSSTTPKSTSCRATGR